MSAGPALGEHPAAPEHEGPRVGGDRIGDAFSDAVTLAWADPRAGVHVLARVGLAGGRRASGLAVLFVDGDVVAAVAEGGVEVSSPSDDWSGVGAGGVSAVVVEPLTRFTASLAAPDGSGFSVEAEALGPPGWLRAGGMSGYEQPVRVRGSVTLASGRSIAVDGLGQRGHTWGEADWGSLSRVRSFGLWMDDRLAIVAQAAARDGLPGHGEEEVDAVVFEGEGMAPASVEEPLVTTAWDAEGRQRRAGLELWSGGEGEDVFPRSASGSVVCGTTLDLGRLRLDVSFLRWRMEGRECSGRLDVVRRAV